MSFKNQIVTITAGHSNAEMGDGNCTWSGNF